MTVTTTMMVVLLLVTMMVAVERNGEPVLSSVTLLPLLVLQLMWRPLSFLCSILDLFFWLHNRVLRESQVVRSLILWHRQIDFTLDNRGGLSAVPPLQSEV